MRPWSTLLGLEPVLSPVSWCPVSYSPPGWVLSTHSPTLVWRRLLPSTLGVILGVGAGRVYVRGLWAPGAREGLQPPSVYSDQEKLSFCFCTNTTVDGGKDHQRMEQAFSCFFNKRSHIDCHFALGLKVM